MYMTMTNHRTDRKCYQHIYLTAPIHNQNATQTQESQNMKNRIITKDEINKITNECKPREKAFFTIMRQSGIEPCIIKELKIKNVEKILEAK
jgi:hypothetical protein